MYLETVRRLLELNRIFYSKVAEPFNRTRYGDSIGMLQFMAYLQQLLPQASLRTLDVGCGNGRMGWMLERMGWSIEYTGVDGEPRLLALAQENTRDLTHVHTQWHQADLAEPGWTRGLTPPYDVVICFSTLQHMPSFELRARVVADLAGLVTEEGCVAVSAWQFLRSERLAVRQLPWEEVGINPSQVEPGDALLPWKQEHYAVRYVHQIDLAEMEQLATHAGLNIELIYYADGREGNLNLYAIMKRM